MEAEMLEALVIGLVGMETWTLDALRGRPMKAAAHESENETCHGQPWWGDLEGGNVNREQIGELLHILLPTHSVSVQDIEYVAYCLWQAIEAAQITPEKEAVLQAAREWAEANQNDPLLGDASLRLLTAVERLKWAER